MSSWSSLNVRNVIILIKNYLHNFLGSLVKRKKTARNYLAVLLCVLFSVAIIFTFTGNAISTTQLFLRMSEEVPGAYKMAMFTSGTLSVLMLLFITIMRSVYPSKAKDTSLLLSLPIKRSEIVVAKSLYNYLFDLTIFLSIILPSYVVYLVLVPGVDGWFLVRGIIFILCLPLLSNAVATFLGAFFNMLARRMKHYAIFQSIISILMLGFYLVANYSIQGYLMGISGTVEEVIASIKPIEWQLGYLLDGKVLFMIALGAICIVLYSLSLLYTSNRLGKLELRYQNKSHVLVYKARKPVRALVNKELKQYFNMPIYLMNTIIPGVLYFGLGVAACILGRDKALNFLSRLPIDITGYTDLVIALLFSLLISSYVITGSCISLEGKHYDWLRSSPIDEKTLFISKIGANMVLTTVVVVITYPFLLTFMNLAYWWCYLLLPLASSLAMSTLGLVINLCYPKMEWEREEQVVKSSMASAISIFAPMIIGVIPLTLYLASLKNYLTPQLFILVVSMFYVIIFLLCVLWLHHKGKKALFKVFDGGKL